MTDTTAIKALREAALKATPGPWVTVDYFWIAQEKDGHGGEFIVFDNGPDAAYVRNLSPDRILALLDQLEAERQRADDAHKYGSERDSENESLMHTVGRLRVEIAELKGEQVPVAEIKFHPSTDKHPCMYWFGKQDRDFPVGTRFFTAPQKPVVLPGISELIDACDSTPAMRDIHVWDLAISEVKRLNPSLFSDKSAADGIVKDGE